MTGVQTCALPDLSHNPVLTLYVPRSDPIFNIMCKKKQGKVRKNLWGRGREELVRWGGGRGRRRKGNLAAEELVGRGGGGVAVDRKLHAMADMAMAGSHRRGGEGDAAARMPMPVWEDEEEDQRHELTWVPLSMAPIGRCLLFLVRALIWPNQIGRVGVL